MVTDVKAQAQVIMSAIALCTGSCLVSLKTAIHKRNPPSVSPRPVKVNQLLSGGVMERKNMYERVILNPNTTTMAAHFAKPPSTSAMLIPRIVAPVLVLRQHDTIAVSARC